MATRKCKRGIKKGTRSCKRKPGPKKSSRKCRRGRRKGSKSCKRKPGPKRSGRKRRSRRRSKFKMMALRTDQSVKDKVLNAGQNPTRQNLKMLTNLQLDQLCKLNGIKGCSTKNRTSKINFIFKKLEKLNANNPFASAMVSDVRYDDVVGEGMTDNLREAMNEHGMGMLNKETLKKLTVDELNHFCKNVPVSGGLMLGIKGCSNVKSKSALIRYILRKLAPGGNVVVDPPPANLAASEIEGMTGKTLRVLCKNLGISCNSEGGKRLNTRQQKDKLLIHYGHSPVSNMELMTADSHNLKKMCKRFGVTNCHSRGGVKTSDAEVRNMLMLTGMVG